jgi:hypothetical protein
MSSERMAIGLLVLAIVVMASLAPARSDTWWLIRAGDQIWQSGEVPLVDTYSHTIRGRPWPNQEWLTELLFYTAHRIAGMRGLAVLCTALIVFAWGVSWALTSGRFEARFTLFALSLTASAGAWAMRPQLLTMAFFAMTCWLLARNKVWWLPLNILVWANFHGAVILGVIAIGAALLMDALRTRRIPFDLTIAGAASAAMTLLTPLGVDLWTLLVAHGLGPRGDGIEEWMRPAVPPANPAFWGIVAALIVGLVYRRPTLNAAHARLIAVSLAMLPFAISAQRGIAVFLLVAVPAVCALWARRFGDQMEGRIDRNSMNTAILGAASIAAIAFIGRVWLHPPDSLGWSPLLPEAVRAVAACPQPLYNTYDAGGALIWFVPEQPVFIDSRYDPYPIQLFVDNEQLERTGAYDALFTRHGIRCAIVAAGMPTDLALRGDADWAMTYSDDTHAVFVRR